MNLSIAFFAAFLTCLIVGVSQVSSDAFADNPAPASIETTSVTVTPNDPNIRAVGRWDMSDPATFHSYWGGAYLRTRFTGTSVGIKVATWTTLVVSIDEEAFRSVSAGPGVTSLNMKPLKPGTHSLLVGSSGQNDEVQFQGLALEAGASTMPDDSPQPPLIEFVGDSITTGTGPVGITTVNWTWNTATALGCDHIQIAFSGLALTSGFGCLPIHTGLDQLYFLEKNYNHLPESPQVPWSFSYTPDVVVINLGQNDQCGQEPATTLTQSMTSFVSKIRSHFPHAQIAVMRPYAGVYGDAIQAAVNSLNASGDTKVRYIDTGGWIGKPDTVDGIHPNAVGNLKIAGHLVPLLRPLLPSH